MSRWRVRVRTTPKDGAPGGLNQDQAAVRIGRDHRGSSFVRIGLADGATSAFRSEAWAKALVDAVAIGHLGPRIPNREFARRIAPLAHDWSAANPPTSRAWYHKAHAAQGSYAAILGLTIRRAGRQWRWRAVAIGDVDLFEVDSDCSLRRAFPLTRADSFTRDPILVATKPAANAMWLGHRLRSQGTIPPRGSLVLASDAVASWALRQQEAGEMPLGLLRDAATSGAAFTELIRGLRKRREIANDDATMIWLDRR